MLPEVCLDKLIALYDSAVVNLADTIFEAIGERMDICYCRVPKAFHYLAIGVEDVKHIARACLKCGGGIE